jgi:tetratricopeptide (TPR) repeat protein
LATIHHGLGILLDDTSRAQEAEAAYRDALAIQKQLAADFPTAPQYRQGLALSLNTLAGLLKGPLGRPKEGETAHRDALAIQKQLAADFPTVPEYREDLATSHNNLGNLLRDTGRAQEAEAAYRAALPIQKQLAAEFPADPRYRQNLARSHFNLATLLRIIGRAQEAEAGYHDALPILKQLTADFPTVPYYQAQLGNTLIGLAVLSRARKGFPSARQLLEQARPHVQAALEANAHHPFFRRVFRDHRQTLAATLLDLADHPAAAEAADDLARIAFDPANDTYNAACFLSLCVPLARNDAKLPDAKREELARSYGIRAMEMLRQALAKGYKDAAHMKNDSDLNPLRSRDDFKKLLADLDKGVK